VEAKSVSEILTGTIRGQGGRTTCIVSVVKSTQRGSKDPIYTDYRIRDVRENLEDGNYQLTVNGETLALHLENGQWSVDRRTSPPANQ
jgi:hypothetical protein